MATLKKNRYLLNAKEALLLYKSKILPFFDQGDLFYESANADQVRGLQTIQNKGFKIIYSKKAVGSQDEVHVKSKLLKTKDRRLLNLLKYGHSLSYHLTNLVEQGEHSLRSNRKHMLKPTRASKSNFEKFFVYKSIKLWNQLPEEVKELRLMFNFATRVKKELLLPSINFPE